MGKAATRSVYLDALRSFALARVVFYHATGLWVATAFTAMPLMFFIAGSLYAGSIERRPTKQVIVDRYRRILFPYWLYVVALIVVWTAMGVIGQVNPLAWISFAMPVLSFNGPEGPGRDTLLAMTWIPLWYLQAHLIFSLIGGWMRKMQLKHGRRYWIAIVVLMLVTLPIGIGAMFFYAIGWSLGYVQHDGKLEPWLRTRWKKIAIATGPIGLVLFISFQFTIPAVAVLGGIALSAFWLAVALGLRPTIEPLLNGSGTRALVSWMSSRSLTIYVWHSLIIYAVIELAFPGYESPWARLAWVIALLPVVAVVVGWAEDLAAKKKPQLWPRQRIDITRAKTSPSPKLGDAPSTEAPK